MVPTGMKGFNRLQYHSWKKMRSVTDYAVCDVIKLCKLKCHVKLKLPDKFIYLCVARYGLMLRHKYSSRLPLDLV